MSAGPRLLCMMQLPPPIHGASMINQYIADSSLLGSRFTLDVLPMRFAESIEDISSVSIRKLVHMVTTGGRLVRALAGRRPKAVYFTLSPVGGAFYRDCIYLGIMKAFDVPRILHLHGKGISAQVDTRWKRELYSWAFRGASVIHLSPALASDTASVVSHHQVSYVPNGVPDHGDPESRSSSAPAGPPKVLFLSNMVEQKGPLVLLDALGKLHARGIAFTATFAGSQSACLEEFHARVAAHDLGGKVRYVGPAHGEAKAALFRDHDVFAFPTYYAQEAFPLVLLEAMQRGLPVVTTFEGAIPEIVAEGETGFLVPQRNADQLADRLATLIADPDLRRKMGAQGRTRYVERYTLSNFERTLAEALDRCLAAPRVSS